MITRYTFFTEIGIVKKVILNDGQPKYLIEVDDEEGVPNYCLLPSHRVEVSMEEVMDPEAYINHPAELLLITLYGLDKLHQLLSTKELSPVDTLKCECQIRTFNEFLKGIGFKKIIMPPYDQQWLH